MKLRLVFWQKAIRFARRANKELFIYLLLQMLMVPQFGILNRFPWQDLLYGDLQVYNRWRWFAESLRNQGFLGGIFSNTDFLMGTGENTVLTSRAPTPLFDIGAWAYYLTGSIDISFFVKLFIYSFVAFLGIKKMFKLFYLNSEVRNVKYFIYFTIVLGSILSHPNLLGDIGSMVLWYLFLIPSWIDIFRRVMHESWKDIFFSANSIFVFFLTLGSSDLFIFFLYLSLLFIIITIFRPNKKQILKLFVYTTVVEIVLLLSKINYIYYSLSEYSTSHSGTWNASDYLKFFILPELKFALFFPHFVAPTIIYLNFVIIFLCIYLYRIGKGQRAFLIAPVLNLILLLLFGILLHAIPFIRDNLPSAFRYHLGPWPIIFFSVLPIWMGRVEQDKRLNGSLDNALEGKTCVEAKLRIILIALIFTFPSLGNIYAPVTPSNNKRVLDYELRDYVFRQIPTCINMLISSSPFMEKSRQYLFETTSSERGINDLLESLIEKPDSLFGRTFNHWRYSTSISNFTLNAKYGLGGFFTWAFSNQNEAEIRGFAKATGARFLIGTEVHSNSFVSLGSCQGNEELLKRFMPFRSPLTGEIEGNKTYTSKIHVYYIDFPEEKSLPTNSKYYSDHASFVFNCNSNELHILPINYSKDLRITLGNAGLSNFESNLDSLVQFRVNSEFCSEGGEVLVQVKTFNLIELVNLILLSFMIMVGGLALFMRRQKFWLDFEDKTERLAP